jgi:lytic murein transglycosylase
LALRFRDVSKNEKGKGMRKTWAVIVLSLACALAGPVAAQDKAGVERQFQSWLERTVWPKARAKGVSRATFERAFDGVTLNWSLPELVPPGGQTAPKGQKQAEFGAPARYFRPARLEADTAAGKRMARRHAKALAMAEAATGVPGRIILGVWGRESGYGQVPIRHNAFEVLGTKGFMSTRPEFFTAELIAALQIVERGLAPKGTLRSSWAGALGQPQFLPTSYLKYARDGNGDGRADIWGSEADTIASIATYLAGHGWVPGRDWGFEVRVPRSVSCTLEGPDQARRISDWTAMGITRVSGRPFPEHEARAQGLPDDARGPLWPGLYRDAEFPCAEGI